MRKMCCIILIILFVTGCQNEDKTNMNEKNNDKTKTEQSLSSKYEHYKMNCNDVNNNVNYFTSTEMVLENSIYRIVLDPNKKFSNEQQCKKTDGLTVDRIIINNNSAYGSMYIYNNGVYGFNGDTLIDYVANKAIILLSKEEDIVSISQYGYSFNEDDGTQEFVYYILKDDGNVYEYIVSEKNLSARIKSKNNIVYSSEIYGYIKYFYYSGSFDKKIENIVILSDKGLYTMEEKENEECKDYVDVECPREMILNKEYAKYKDEIIYFDKNYFVDEKNNIYSTSDFIEIRYIP